MRITRIAAFLLLFLWPGNLFAEKLLTVFTANWCGPCQQFKQDILKDPGITAQYKVELIDIDTHENLVQDKKIKVFPTFIISEYQDDKEVEISRMTGYGRAELPGWLKKHRDKPKH